MIYILYGFTGRKNLGLLEIRCIQGDTGLEGLEFRALGLGFVLGGLEWGC